MTTEQKYALTQLEAGDYLLPSNDGQRLWRIRESIRGNWIVWRWLGGPPFEGSPNGKVRAEFRDWAMYEVFDGGYATRKAAIEAALGF